MYKSIWKWLRKVVEEKSRCGYNTKFKLFYPNISPYIKKRWLQYQERATMLKRKREKTEITVMEMAGPRAWVDRKDLISIVISNKVTSIGESAFQHCSDLTTVVNPDSVTRSGSRAFNECTRLTSIVIPDSVTIIEEAFLKCRGITTIGIPNSVTSIGWSAFYGCTGLASIVIPDSVTSIKEASFDGCSGLHQYLFLTQSLVFEVMPSKDVLDSHR